MSVKLLSMDTSSSSTGICRFVDGEYQGYSLLQTDKKLKGDEKLEQMIELVYKYIDKELPDLITVEMVAVVRNPQVQRMLTELTGAIRGKCVGNHIGYYAMRPTEWRKQVEQMFNQKPAGRKREDLKAWSLDIVNNKLGVETDCDDVSDAVLIGHAYINLFNK